MNPIRVAASLQSIKGATRLQPNTLAFDGPKGDGRSGAKGILLKTNPGSGSTWSFDFIRSRGTEGHVQMIHPMGRGHVLIVIKAKEIGVGAPDTWAEVGWGSGETKNVRQKPAFQKFFPLKDDVKYEIVSRVTAGGAIEVFFDGQMVISARVSNPRPLSLAIPAGGYKNSGRTPSKFSGTDLPMVWSPGWAGIIAGPVDGSRNELADLKFTPAVNAAVVKR